MWKLILVMDQINKANLQACQRICIRNKDNVIKDLKTPTQHVETDSCYRPNQ